MTQPAVHEPASTGARLRAEAQERAADAVRERRPGAARRRREAGVAARARLLRAAVPSR